MVYCVKQQCHSNKAYSNPTLKQREFCLKEKGKSALYGREIRYLSTLLPVDL